MIVFRCYGWVRRQVPVEDILEPLQRITPRGFGIKADHFRLDFERFEQFRDPALCDRLSRLAPF